MSTANAKEILQATFQQIDEIVKEKQKNNSKNKQEEKSRSRAGKVAKNHEICSAKCPR